jgi:hypothetical protein
MPFWMNFSPASASANSVGAPTFHVEHLAHRTGFDHLGRPE